MRAAQELHGQHILLTRAKEDNASWATVIERQGGRSTTLPCISCEFVEDPKLEERLLAALREADLLAMTSRRGVRAVAKILHRHEKTFPVFLEVAAVGESTAREAQIYLMPVRFRAPESTAESLAQQIVHAIQEGKYDRPQVVAALAENADDTLQRALGPHSTQLDRFNIYRTLPAQDAKSGIDFNSFDAIFLASPSAVAGLKHQCESALKAALISIGPATTAAVRNLGWTVAAEATERNVTGMIQAFTQTLSSDGSAS